MMGSPIGLYLEAHVLVSDVPREVASWREHFASVHVPVAEVGYKKAVISLPESGHRKRTEKSPLSALCCHHQNHWRSHLHVFSKVFSNLVPVKRRLFEKTPVRVQNQSVQTS